eukprot:31102-Pyramimonas_sp.AAC.1
MAPCKITAPHHEMVLQVREYRRAIGCRSLTSTCDCHHICEFELLREIVQALNVCKLRVPMNEREHAEHNPHPARPHKKETKHHVHME